MTTITTERSGIRSLLEQLERGAVVEAADLDWGDLEGEVRDLAVLVRRKNVRGIVEAVDRINELLLQHVGTGI